MSMSSEQLAEMTGNIMKAMLEKLEERQTTEKESYEDLGGKRIRELEQKVFPGSRNS